MFRLPLYVVKTGHVHIVQFLIYKRIFVNGHYTSTFVIKYDSSHNIKDLLHLSRVYARKVPDITGLVL